LEPPRLALKFNADGAGMVVSLNSTGIDKGLLVAPAEVTVMLPLFPPAGTPDGLAATVMLVTPVVPLVGLTESQFPVLDAESVNDTWEPVEDLTLSNCVAGVAPFTDANVNDDGEGWRLNGAALTVKPTGIVSGELEAAV
jgi:hypothetical protein